MRELVQLIQTASFIGIFFGLFLSSKSKTLKFIPALSIVLCLGATLLDNYWEEAAAFFSGVFTWVKWGVLAIVAVVLLWKIIRYLVKGKEL